MVAYCLQLGWMSTILLQVTVSPLFLSVAIRTL
jgi:hypothetical protein